MNAPVSAARLAQTENAASNVLEAERAALAQVELCRQRALQLVAESKASAELVRMRTKDRIERLRQRMAAGARLNQERIHGETAALASDMGTAAPVLATLDRAIALIVDELVGNLEPP